MTFILSNTLFKQSVILKKNESWIKRGSCSYLKSSPQNKHFVSKWSFVHLRNTNEDIFNETWDILVSLHWKFKLQKVYKNVLKWIHKNQVFWRDTIKLDVRNQWGLSNHDKQIWLNCLLPCLMCCLCVCVVQCLYVNKSLKSVRHIKPVCLPKTCNKPLN